MRLVVPFSAGGATDIVARIIAQKMSEGWGQQAIVDNKPGAGTVIATNFVAKAPPDGYTRLHDGRGSYCPLDQSKSSQRVAV